MDKFIREPFINSGVSYAKELHRYPSPNGAFELVISHQVEYKPAKRIYLFSLLDSTANIVENFEPLITTGKNVWSPNSNFLAIEIGVDKIGYLIYDVPNKQFAFIPFRRKPAAKIAFSDHQIHFVMPQDFIEVLNSGKLIGGGQTELPRIKYEKAPDLNFDLLSADYFGKEELANIFKQALDATNFEPIRNGFWEFKGRLPQNTVDGYNGRPFEIYQLEVFAEYGDKVSKKWLDMILEKAEGKYQLYKPVSDYLGRLERKDYSE